MWEALGHTEDAVEAMTPSRDLVDYCNVIVSVFGHHVPVLQGRWIAALRRGKVDRSYAGGGRQP